MQAALGLAQMEQLDSFIETKRINYEHYKRDISNIPGLSVLGFREGTRSNHWFYSVYCDEPFALERDALIARLGEQKIQCRPIWGLIHEQKPYEGSLTYNIETAKRYHKHIVNVPCSTNLSDDDVDCVISCIKGVIENV